MIISLTHALHRTAVAEGVETDAQAALLRAMGCDQYQGYLFKQAACGGGCRGSFSRAWHANCV